MSATAMPNIGTIQPIGDHRQDVIGAGPHPAHQGRAPLAHSRMETISARPCKHKNKPMVVPYPVPILVFQLGNQDSAQLQDNHKNRENAISHENSTNTDLPTEAQKTSEKNITLGKLPNVTTPEEIKIKKDEQIIVKSKEDQKSELDEDQQNNLEKEDQQNDLEKEEQTNDLEKEQQNSLDKEEQQNDAEKTEKQIDLEKEEQQNDLSEEEQQKDLDKSEEKSDLNKNQQGNSLNKEDSQKENQRSKVLLKGGRHTNLEQDQEFVNRVANDISFNGKRYVNIEQCNVFECFPYYSNMSRLTKNSKKIKTKLSGLQYSPSQMKKTQQTTKKTIRKRYMQRLPVYYNDNDFEKILGFRRTKGNWPVHHRPTNAYKSKKKLQDTKLPQYGLVQLTEGFAKNE